MVNIVGNTKVCHWIGGVTPELVEGATLLGYRKVGGCLELALYELANGDFCSITGDSGKVVPRQEFPQLVIDEGCPWEFTDAQFKRMKKLLGKIKAENQDSGYDALKVAAAMQLRNGVIAELFKQFVSEALKTYPPDIDAADKAVIKAIVEKVDSMGLKDGDKCMEKAHSLYRDFRNYTSKTFKKVEQKMCEVA